MVVEYLLEPSLKVNFRSKNPVLFSGHISSWQNAASGMHLAGDSPKHKT
jgi:hypothetical protein